MKKNWKKFCNKKKSHDFNENGLKTQLRMFSINFSKQNDTNIDDVIEHFMSMPSSVRKMISELWSSKNLRVDICVDFFSRSVLIWKKSEENCVEELHLVPLKFLKWNKNLCKSTILETLLKNFTSLWSRGRILGAWRGALCVEMGFTWTFPRNQDAKVKLKSELISIKF